MDQTFVYAGPLSAVSLPADQDHPDGRQVMLHPGGQVRLPADNAYVQALVARGHLKPVPQAQAAPAQQAAATSTPTAPPAETKTSQTGAAASAAASATGA